MGNRANVRKSIYPICSLWVTLGELGSALYVHSSYTRTTLERVTLVVLSVIVFSLWLMMESSRISNTLTPVNCCIVREEQTMEALWSEGECGDAVIANDGDMMAIVKAKSKERTNPFQPTRETHIHSNYSSSMNFII